MQLKKTIFILTLLLLVFSPLTSPASENTRVKLETSRGDIIIELYEKKAPVTVSNFIGYVKEGFYDNTIFHRVIKRFMVQGGGFTEEMWQKSTKGKIINEATNGLKNDRGTIAMARTPDPHSATSQFFINTVNNRSLNKSNYDWGYCVFGKVTQGMDVVDKIENVRTHSMGGHQNVPVDAVVIKKAIILK